MEMTNLMIYSAYKAPTVLSQQQDIAEFTTTQTSWIFFFCFSRTESDTFSIPAIEIIQTEFGFTLVHEKRK